MITEYLDFTPSGFLRIFPYKYSRFPFSSQIYKRDQVFSILYKSSFDFAQSALMPRLYAKDNAS